MIVVYYARSYPAARRLSQAAARSFLAATRDKTDMDIAKLKAATTTRMKRSPGKRTLGNTYYIPSLYAAYRKANRTLDHAYPDIGAQQGSSLTVRLPFGYDVLIFANYWNNVSSPALTVFRPLESTILSLISELLRNMLARLSCMRPIDQNPSRLH
ncbi:hypothetical protein BDR07DRAFT_1376604 [Suillus spraguei]|nr:hypothetical protein BDR07DRAFT_1376604 [Suillus spraguei]